MASIARYAYQLIVALYLGGGVFFAAAVAPALFQTLGSAQAAAVVGRLLPLLERSALVLPLLLGAAAWLVEGAPRGEGRLRAGVLVAMVVVGAAGVLWVTPQIAALRAQAGGDISALAAGDPMRRAFGRWHGVSVLLLGANLVLAAVALGLTPRAR